MGLPSYEVAIRLNPSLLNITQGRSPTPAPEGDMVSLSTRSRQGSVVVSPIFENQFRKSEPDNLARSARVRSARRTVRVGRGSTVSPSISSMLEQGEVGVAYTQVQPYSPTQSLVT